MKLPAIVLSAMLLSTTSAFAQSLKPESPAPLQSGINSGTVDNFVGTHYWFFEAQPGHVRVHVQFTSMGLLGNASRANVTFTLADAAHTWQTPKVLTSDGKPVVYDFNGDMKNPTKLLLSVAPPDGGLVRTGGDYQIEATGAVSFGQKSDVDPVIGTYNEMTGYTSLLGTCKFLPDGKIETTSGTSGSWKLFDKGSQTYVINIDGQDRHSLQLVPGRGLCDNDMILFQSLR
jgi:hypothetical protein